MSKDKTIGLIELPALGLYAWGITVNIMQDRQVTWMLIKHLSSMGRPVVVGGSDAIVHSHS